MSDRSLRRGFSAARCAFGVVKSAVLGIAGLFVAASSLRAESGEEFFESKIRPILVEQCENCHGAKKQWSELRLDSQEAMLRGGELGPAIVPGDPEASRLIQAVRRKGELQMPPERSLTPVQIAALEEWVRQGAPWPARRAGSSTDAVRPSRSHWAFQPVRRVDPPNVDSPEWSGSFIDRWVFAKLNDVGLSPSPPADRRTLIRRATYDLTGLPPAPDDVSKFIGNDDPRAYEQLVDRLLASSAYGEHQARRWLDVARYADSKGYVYAREERFWIHAATYRDWVVRAFQEGMPYDRFLTLQIAADLAAPNDRASWAAMGFLTLGRRFLGVTHDIIDDRIDVVARGALGLTVACARCHDHKYDPISSLDYYGLYGVYLNSREEQVPLEVGPDGGWPLTGDHVDRKRKLDDTLAEKRNEATERARTHIAKYLVAQTDLANVPAEGFDVLLGADDAIPATVRRWDEYLSQPERTDDPVFRPWRRFAALSPAEFQDRSADVLRKLTEEPGDRVNSAVLAALASPGPPTSMRDVAERYGRVMTDVVTNWRKRVADAEKAGTPTPAAMDDPALESLRLSMYGAQSPCIVPNEPMVAVEGFFDTPTCEALWKIQGDFDRGLNGAPNAPPFTTRLVDRTEPRDAHVLRRGDPRSRGALAPRRFLSILAGPDATPFAHGSGRLELAQAIASPRNPLTARVWVNRIWLQHFGAGLVTTPSDFGTRADPPSHPELLDALATFLVENRWSTKALQREILLSRTYRQASSGPRDAVERERADTRDPANRFLWRMSPKRLTFEEFRDSLLAVSARLDATSGGKATDLFAGDGLNHRRRTLYGLIDRQFFASTLRTFDVANPDLHIPLRSETTSPQQALFALNHPLMAESARSLVAAARTRRPAPSTAERVQSLIEQAYQRDASDAEIERAARFLDAPDDDSANPAPRPEAAAWQYGWGELDYTTHTLKGFQKLPYFTGNAWQGAANWPGGGLGWLQLTADGGHTGDDLQHSVVRRWTAPRAGRYAVTSTVVHATAAGDGIRCYVIASRGGLLKSATVFNRREEMNVDSIALEAGDVIDFVADLNMTLHSEEHLWAPRITRLSTDTNADAAVPADGGLSLWDAIRDFTGPATQTLDRWEQLAQVLLMSNEFFFVD